MEYTVVEGVKIEHPTFWLRVCLIGLYNRCFIMDFNMQR